VSTQRDYQSEIIDDFDRRVDRSVRSVTAPTGSGKTVIAAGSRGRGTTSWCWSIAATQFVSGVGSNLGCGRFRGSESAF
jgi:hypothetical protein